MDVDCVDTSATEAVASHRPAAPDMLFSTVRTVRQQVDSYNHQRLNCHHLEHSRESADDNRQALMTVVHGEYAHPQGGVCTATVTAAWRRRPVTQPLRRPA